MVTHSKWLVLFPLICAQENPRISNPAVTGIAWNDVAIRRRGSTDWPVIELEGQRLPIFWAVSLLSLHPIMSHHSSSQSPETPHPTKSSKHDYSDSNIRNFAPVARIMKTALPENAKIAKEAKECMQECVSEFISFITSEGLLVLSHLHTEE